MKGYTLIELLVGITIIGFIFSFGFVSFRDFSRRQAVAGTAKEIKGNLRLAQSEAIDGKKPDSPNCAGTNLLNGYNFKVNSNRNYSLEANCSGGTVRIKSVDLQNDIFISTPSPNPITFKALGQGTNINSGATASIIVTQTATNNQVVITVTSGGEIK